MRRVIVVLVLLCFTTPALASHHRHHHYHHHHRVHIRASDPVAAGLGIGLARILKDMGKVRGLQPNFLDKLKQALADSPVPCRVGSGYRSHAEQAALHRAKPRMAAAPGHSNHERGLAADLSCGRGGLAWLHAHARRYGLCFPMSHEAWHIEPIGATRFARRHTRYAHHRYRHYAHAA